MSWVVSISFYAMVFSLYLILISSVQCRGGELVETLAGSDEFGEFFKKEDVEWLLDAHLNLDSK